MNARRLAVSRGDDPADLVLSGGKVFSVFTREWLDADVAVVDGVVAGVGSYARGRRRLDVRGAYLVPGFIDAHVHIESSKLMVDQFSRAVLPHGTTAVVADPHEIANVLGTDGVHWLLDACDTVPLEVFVMAPSCVPASPLESPRRPFTLGDLAGLLRRHRSLGIAEMMNFPGVIAGRPGELGKLQIGAGHVDGHAPGVRGARLNAYIGAGMRSDHECSTYEEALEKRRLGMWIMLREGSAARNLVDLLPLVRDHGPERCMFCTDDREPVFLVDEGHIDQMLRKTVEHGVRAEDALVMATLHPAEYHGLRHLGAIAPGYQADIVVLDDLRTFKPRLVLKRGAEPVHRPIEIPEWVRQTVHVAPLHERSFEITGPARRIRVMRVIAGQLVTGSDVVEAPARNGLLVADPDRDLVKIAVVERHHATGRIGLGFATDVGLRRGAFASTVAHDAHNVVVLGVDDADMLLCVRRLAQIGGGVVVADGGEIKGELALPVAGLMSDAPLAAVHEELVGMEHVLHGNGVKWEAPFMCLSFLALSVIPELKITDRGLVDVNRFEVVPLRVD